MRIVGHGVDIVRIERVERIWREHGERFLQRILTSAEIAYCLDCKTPGVRLAGRFAVKEAILKALGTGWRAGIEWTDLEVLPDGYGAPQLRISGKTESYAKVLKIEQILVSISHTDENAIGSAIAVGD